MLIGSKEAWAKLEAMKTKNGVSQRPENQKKFYSLKAEGETAFLAINDAIDSFFGVDASALATDIKDLDAKQIDVEVNSPGGEVFAGVALYNALKSHPAKVNVKVNGMAASIASVIALAGDEKPEMAPMSKFMIHNAWTMAMGDHNDLRDTADVLESISGDLANLYAQTTGKPVDEIKMAMDDETWLGVDEAIEFGLARGEASQTPTEDEQALAMARGNLARNLLVAKALSIEVGAGL